MEEMIRQLETLYNSINEAIDTKKAQIAEVESQIPMPPKDTVNYNDNWANVLADFDKLSQGIVYKFELKRLEDFRNELVAQIEHFKTQSNILLSKGRQLLDTSKTSQNDSDIKPGQKGY